MLRPVVVMNTQWQKKSERIIDGKHIGRTVFSHDDGAVGGFLIKPGIAQAKQASPVFAELMGQRQAGIRAVKPTGAAVARET